MTEWTTDQAAAFAEKYPLPWLTPDLLEELRACADRVTATARAVPRMPSEYQEPAHIFRGPE